MGELEATGRIAVGGERLHWLRLREAFRVHEWTAARLEARFGGEALNALAGGDPERLRRRASGDDPANRRARLWLLGEAFSPTELDEALTPTVRHTAETLGLLVAGPRPETLQASVGWWPADDEPIAVPLPGEADFPRRPGPFDRLLGDLGRGSSGGTTLLAGCGNGLTALRVAAHAGTFRITEKSVSGARRIALTLALHGYDPDARGLVTVDDLAGVGGANCDGVVRGGTPWAEILPLDPNVGPDGLAETEAELPRRLQSLLRPRGTAAAASIVPATDGDPTPALTALQAAGAACGLDLLVFVAEFVPLHELVLRQALAAGGPLDAAALGARCGQLAAAGWSGVRRLLIRAEATSARGVRPLFHVEELPAIRGGDAAGQLVRMRQGLDYLSRLVSPRKLLEDRFVPAPGTAVENSARILRNAWSVTRSELVCTEGLGFRTPLGTTWPQLLPTLDGTQTFGEMLSAAATAAEGEYPLEAYVVEAVPILKMLLVRGMVKPARPSLAWK